MEMERGQDVLERRGDCRCQPLEADMEILGKIAAFALRSL